MTNQAEAKSKAASIISVDFNYREAPIAAIMEKLESEYPKSREWAWSTLLGICRQAAREEGRYVEGEDRINDGGCDEYDFN